MNITIKEEHIKALHQYGDISIAFQVESVFDLEPVEDGLGGIKLTERVLDQPYIKYYGENKGFHPRKKSLGCKPYFFGEFSDFIRFFNRAIIVI